MTALLTSPSTLSLRRSAPPPAIGERQTIDRDPRHEAYGGEYCRYLPEDVASPASRFSLLGLGRTTIEPGDAYPKATHPRLYSLPWRAGRTLAEHQVVLLSNAAGEFESEAIGCVRLLGDVLIFLRPGVWHRYRPLHNGGWTERWVSLHGSIPRRLFAEAGVGDEAPVFPAQQPDRLKRVFDAMIAMTRGTSFVSDRAAEAALQLVGEAIHQATEKRVVNPLDRTHAEATDMRGPQSDVDDEIVKQALEIIWNHEHCPPLGVNDVARLLPVTRRTLDRHFAEALGRTVLDEITACRVSRARRLLAETDLPIKSVAYRAGFPSRERLRLAFLAHEGMPPSEYREDVLKQRDDQETT